MLRKFLLIIIAILVLMQFIRIDKEAPKSDPSKDLIAISQPPTDVQNILKTACYDCHSNETAYPWYTNIAPVSWWLEHHIDEGREELNFSEWGNYSVKKANHKIEECVELVKAGEMPLSSYTWMHSEAKLSEEQRRMLCDYFATLQK